MVKLFCEQNNYPNRLTFELISGDKYGQFTIHELAKPWFQITSDPSDADWIMIPYLLSSLIDGEGKNVIQSHSFIARKYEKPLVIVSDSDLVYDPGVSDILILSPGPYASLGNQLALPAILKEDPVKKFYQGKFTPITEFTDISLGFCGQATENLLKTAKDALNLLILRRQIKQKRSPYLYIPFFLAAYERAKFLKFLQKKSKFKTDFLLRQKYKAGANTLNEKAQVEKEFFENISNNLFTVCLRGFGNYSVRFFQTLAMGRIPILIETDGLLPFEDKLPYDDLIVRVPYSDRYAIDEYITDFLKGKSKEELIEIQTECRRLWVSTMNLEGMFRELSENLSRIPTHGSINKNTNG